MPEIKRRVVRNGMVGVGLLMAVACGRISGPAESVYTIQEDRVTTPAGTEHVQVLVPSGAFVMGSDVGTADEQPVHKVDLDAFYIDKFEVTNAQYMAYVDATGAEPPQFIREEAYNKPDQPVVGVFWGRAKAYCEWAGMELPTEAQWEKAAGGTDGHLFPWGDGAPDQTLANFIGSGPVAVGSYPEGASPYGAYDMAGNVWEWTLDEYDYTFYARSPKLNPFNSSASGGADHTLRGGSWSSPAPELRVAMRSSIYILEEQSESSGGDLTSPMMYASIGFRCARAASQ